MENIPRCIYKFFTLVCLCVGVVFPFDRPRKKLVYQIIRIRNRHVTTVGVLLHKLSEIGCVLACVRVHS